MCARKDLASIPSNANKNFKCMNIVGRCACVCARASLSLMCVSMCTTAVEKDQKAAPSPVE